MTETVREAASPDFDVLEAAAHARLVALRQRIQSLALDALSDDGAREELAAAEVELSEAEQASGRLRLARAEQERRQTVSLERAERERREAALKRARELQGDRKAAAKILDRQAQAFAGSIASYLDVAHRQQAAFSEAGMEAAATAARPQAYAIEAAFARALEVCAVTSRMWERLPVIPNIHKCPLVEREVDFAGWQLPAEPNTTNDGGTDVPH